MINRFQKYAGILLGTAVGDSLGLPAEGVKRRGIKRLGWKNNWKHRFIFGKGMLSDDTEHTLMVVEAMTAHPDDVDAFCNKLAQKLRWWLLALPAGVGMATTRSILKLWLGFSPNGSGVFSAGNGPAMRSAIIGAYFADSLEKLESYVRASTGITHTDPKAIVGALAVAYCAATPENLPLVWARLHGLSGLDSEEWPQLMLILTEAIESDWTMLEFTRKLGLEAGVSGYTYHTVPVVLFAWFRWYEDDRPFERMLTEVLNCGGDTDTTGAIVGAISGGTFGVGSIPENWKSGIADWPISMSLVESHADCLSKGRPALPVFWIFTVMRNLIFLLIVLVHGFFRLVPCRLRRSAHLA